MFDREVLAVIHSAHMDEFLGWLPDERLRSKALRCAALTLLLHRVYSSAGEDTPIGELWDQIRELEEFAVEPEKDLILGLLPFYYDRSLLVKSKELLSKPWDSRAFLAANNYAPEDDGRTCGISLVIMYDIPADLLAKLEEYFGPAAGAYLRTAKLHFTIASLAEEMPRPEERDMCDQFVREWNLALRQQNGFREVAAKLQRGPKLCADEIRLQGGAVLLFASSDGGFLSAMHEMRLRLMRSILLSVRPSRGSRLQPLWSHSVLGRKISDLRAEDLDGRREWSLAGVAPRVAAQNPYLALMVFGDRKSLLPPLRVVRLSLE